MAKRNSELALSIGKRMATRRKELGLTQSEMAEKCGLSFQFYACIERGIKGISADSIVKICDGLRISADYLLTGKMQETEHQGISKMLEELSETQRKLVEEQVRCSVSLVQVGQK